MTSEPGSATTRPEERPPIKFGVMCQARVLPAWQANSLQLAIGVEGVELAAVIFECPPVVATRPVGRGSVWHRTQRRLAARLPALQTESIDNLIRNTSVFTFANTSPPGGGVAFAIEDVEKIKALSLEFIIHFGPERVTGSVLGAARCGVWYLQPGEDGFAGETAGFWEIHHGHRVSGSSLRRFGNAQESDEILRQGRFRTITASYASNLGQLLDSCPRLLVQACRDLRNGVDPVGEHPTEAHRGLAGGVPSDFQCLLFFLRLKHNKLKNFIRHFFSHRHWGMAVAFSPIQDLWLRPAEATVAFLPPPALDTFYADPFGMEYDGGVAILHERWANAEGAGEIVCTLLDRSTMKHLAANSERQPRVATRSGDVSIRTIAVGMAFSHHCSYPFLFQENGQYYCIPETNEARKVSLFRCTGSPGDWVHVSDLITDFAAVDSTVVKYGGKWWLFCTQEDDHPDSHLYLWHADELTGPWTPHSNNPVKVDISSARPAGALFELEGALYRPAQDCSRNYGGTVVIQKITALSTTQFSEQYCGDLGQLVNALEIDGMHTLSQLGDITLLDYYKKAFLPSILAYRLRRYLQARKKNHRPSAATVSQ